MELAISRGALFDHGGNWFECPKNHFWYWVPDPDMRPPPFELDAEIWLVAQSSPIPATREEAKRFIRVLEMRGNGRYGWRGEWLSNFPCYTTLNDDDLAQWSAWLATPKTTKFLDDTVAECKL